MVILIKYESDPIILLPKILQWLSLAIETSYETFVQNLVPVYFSNFVSYLAVCWEIALSVFLEELIVK